LYLPLSEQREGARGRERRREMKRRKRSKVVEDVLVALLVY
jgi:hypothetical protein